ncbi:MAG TPA: Crp/Fnr family transcriptional regulator [Xanthobacteraceae bacterium]|jgi:CRP-like cAMP-binding protein
MLLEPHLKEVELEQGAILQEQGELIERIYFPHSGMVSLLAVMQQGNAVETATIGREGAVGAMSGLGPRHAFTRALVQMSGSASQIMTAKFQAVVAKSAAIRDIVVRHNEVLLAQVQQSAACNALHEAEARFCRWLLQSRDRSDSDVVPITQEFVAQMLGVRRTTVTLVAQSLQDAGLLRYRRGQIEILDRDTLEARACECYGVVRRAIEQYLPPAGP